MSIAESYVSMAENIPDTPGGSPSIDSPGATERVSIWWPTIRSAARTTSVHETGSGPPMTIVAFRAAGLSIAAIANDAASRIATMEWRCDASPTSVTGLPCARGAATTIPAHTSMYRFGIRTV